jgi:hypothetical protein
VLTTPFIHSVPAGRLGRRAGEVGSGPVPTASGAGGLLSPLLLPQPAAASALSWRGTREEEGKTGMIRDQTCE